jgi:phosphatidylglycerophosphate synthase
LTAVPEAATAPAPRMWLGSLGHLLTATRLASAPLIFSWIGEGSIERAAAALGFAMLTDLIDGPLVRRFGRPSKAGAWFDVWADFLVIVSAFAGFASVGILSFWPLVPIGTSFVVFIATSALRPTMYDPVGRYIGGILMLGALGVLLAHDIITQQVIELTIVIACLTTIVVRVAYALSSLTHIK